MGMPGHEEAMRVPHGYVDDDVHTPQYSDISRSASISHDSDWSGEIEGGEGVVGGVFNPDLDSVAEDHDEYVHEEQAYRQQQQEQAQEQQGGEGNGGNDSCPSCGNELAGTARMFCGKCGFDLRK